MVMVMSLLGGQPGGHYNLQSVFSGIKYWKTYCQSVAPVITIPQPTIIRSESPEVSSAPDHVGPSTVQRATSSRPVTRSMGPTTGDGSIIDTPKFQGFDALSPDSDKKPLTDAEGKRRRLQDSTPRHPAVPRRKVKVTQKRTEVTPGKPSRLSFGGNSILDSVCHDIDSHHLSGPTSP